MGKRVRFDEDARQALWRGIDQLASAVRITLGPRGRSVVLDRAHGLMPPITRDGIAVAQEGRGLGLTLEVVDGVRFAGGYASPYFVTDADDMEVALENPLVLIVDGVLTRPGDIVPALELASAQQRPLLCVCDEIETEAL